jgi:hypothetical protein
MLPRLVTENSEFSWNRETQHFETKIYAPDPVTGKRTLARVYSTPPRIFLKDAMNVQRAVAAFYTDTEHPQAKVIQMKLGQHS